MVGLCTGRAYLILILPIYGGGDDESTLGNRPEIKLLTVLHTNHVNNGTQKREREQRKKLKDTTTHFLYMVLIKSI